MARERYTLDKIKAGEYLLRVDRGENREPEAYRVFKYEALGTGSRGMYGYPVWGAERWDLPRLTPDLDDRDNWTFDRAVSEYDTRGEVIDRILASTPQPADQQEGEPGDG